MHSICVECSLTEALDGLEVFIVSLRHAQAQYLSLRANSKANRTAANRFIIRHWWKLGFEGLNLSGGWRFHALAAHRKKYDILDFHVGTDPRSSMLPMRGTGYYKVPSLRGV